MQKELLNKLLILQKTIDMLSAAPVGSKAISIPMVDWHNLYLLVEEILVLAYMQPKGIPKVDPAQTVLERIQHLVNVTGCEWQQAFSVVAYVDHLNSGGTWEEYGIAK